MFLYSYPSYLELSRKYLVPTKYLLEYLDYFEQMTSRLGFGCLFSQHGDKKNNFAPEQKQTEMSSALITSLFFCFNNHRDVITTPNKKH